MATDEENIKYILLNLDNVLVRWQQKLLQTGKIIIEHLEIFSKKNKDNLD